MRKVETVLMAQLYQKMSDGSIREEHLRALMAMPNAVFYGQGWSEKLICLLPKEIIAFGQMKMIGEKLLYTVYDRGEQRITTVDDDVRRFIVWNGERVAGPFAQNVKDLDFVDGNLTYVTETATNTYVIAWRGEDLVVQSEDDYWPQLGQSAGYLLYAVKRSGKYVIALDGHVIKTIDHKIYALAQNSGHLAYVIERDGYMLVVWDNKEGQRFEHGVDDQTFQMVDGKPFYHAIDDEQDDRPIVWGEEIILRVKGNEPPEEKVLTKNGVIYSAHDVMSDIHVKEWVVDGSLRSKIYNTVFSLHVEGDEIVFGARKGRKVYRVTRKIA